MCPRTDIRSHAWLAPLAALLLIAPFGFAQEREVEPVRVSPDDRVESFLERLGIEDLMIVQLRDRLDRAPASDRPEIAERLGRLYAIQMREASSADERERLLAASYEILREIPDQDHHPLRVMIERTRYLAAEELAERWRVRLATDQEREEAVRSLREARRGFAAIASSASRRIDQLDRLEQRGRGEDVEHIRERRTEIAAIHSEARFFAGWSEYYLAMILGSSQSATASLQEFGWLLGAPDGRIPTLERLSRDMLAREVVARAAIGVALAYAVRGDDADAVAWLDTIERHRELPESVRASMFERRLSVLASTRPRWARVEQLVDQRLAAASRESKPPFSVREARLLTVLALEAVEADAPDPRLSTLILKLAEIGIGELIAMGEIGQVLDLVDRYAGTPVIGDGFIARYVEGLRAYEEAEELADAGDEAIESAATRTAFRDAARALERALATDDAENFERESMSARQRLAFAYFRAGEYLQAADRFEQVFRAEPGEPLREEALWNAVLALERAAEMPGAGVDRRLRTLATLYIGEYPRRERAAVLLVRRTAGDSADPITAVETLLAVDRSSSLRPVAERQAANLLYRVYRDSSGAEREFAASRFLEIAEGVVEHERRAMRDATGSGLNEHGTRAAIVLRQMLDAMLAAENPDPARARRSLTMLREIVSIAGVDKAPFADELLYREVQIALAEGDVESASEAGRRLRQGDHPLAEAAEGLLFRDALARFQRDSSDFQAGREAVESGRRLLSISMSKGGGPGDRQFAAISARVADVAATLWRKRADEQMRDTALEVDGRLVDAGRASATMLLRFAELAEAAEEHERALDAWRRLLTGLDASSPDWFRARHESIRLLMRTSPERAALVMDQHKALHPNFGPEPWGERLRELDRRLDAFRSGGGGG
ncbi:MAG: hypothetical protein JJU33_11215 [Phycisphaerales bacterium]|nr:hypothetical protein [Phycisphaerales bacterium]